MAIWRALYKFRPLNVAIQNQNLRRPGIVGLASVQMFLIKQTVGHIFQKSFRKANIRFLVYHCQSKSHQIYKNKQYVLHQLFCYIIFLKVVEMKYLQFWHPPNLLSSMFLPLSNFFSIPHCYFWINPKVILMMTLFPLKFTQNFMIPSTTK